MTMSLLKLFVSMAIGVNWARAVVARAAAAVSVRRSVFIGGACLCIGVLFGWGFWGFRLGLKFSRSSMVEFHESDGTTARLVK